MANLSVSAKQDLYNWMMEKGYYAKVGGDESGIIPFTQLSIGMMIEYLLDNELSVPLCHNDKYCDLLFEKVKEALDQKN